MPFASKVVQAVSKVLPSAADLPTEEADVAVTLICAFYTRGTDGTRERKREFRLLFCRKQPR